MVGGAAEPVRPGPLSGPGGEPAHRRGGRDGAGAAVALSALRLHPRRPCREQLSHGPPRLLLPHRRCRAPLLRPRRLRAPRALRPLRVPPGQHPRVASAGRVLFPERSPIIAKSRRSPFLLSLPTRSGGCFPFPFSFSGPCSLGRSVPFRATSTVHLPGAL